MSGYTAPKYTFPHTEVSINDNSSYSLTKAVPVERATKMLFVGRFPRGVDGEIVKITNGASELETKFGRGSYAEFGQPILNAYAAAETGYADLDILRIVAPDASRANLYVYVAYKIDKTDSTNPVMKIKYLTKSFEKNPDGSTAAEKMGMVAANTVGMRADSMKPTLEGYTVEYLMAIAAKGRGVYGNNIAIKIVDSERYDKMNDYKNYELQVLESNNIIERNQICLYSAAIYHNSSIYAYDKINDPVDGSDNIIIDVNAEVLETMAQTYHDEIYSKATNKQIYEYGRKYGLKTLIGINKEIEDESDDNHYVVTNLRKYMDLDATNFDPIIGTNKLLNPRVTKIYKNNGHVNIYGLEIEPVEIDDTGAAKNVILTATYGNNLSGGSDGRFALKENGGTAKNQEAIDSAIEAAYAAAYDPQNIFITASESLEEGAVMAVDDRIYSTTRFPLNVIFDAGFPMSVKVAISNLVETRQDCIAIFDVGANLTTKDDILDYGLQVVQYTGGSDTWHNDVECYWGKIHDPQNKKIVPVSATYFLASQLPTHWNAYGDKHVPFAGATYGKLTGFIPGTLFPILDEDLDATLMQTMVDYRLNYAQITINQNVIRGSQYTTQENLSALSELNNVCIVLDIKRDCERICANYGYNFFDESDITRFNRDCEDLVAQYAAAQVQSISGSFTSSDEDEIQGILHLEISLVNKRLVKICMVDINVNRE